jgi:hypothetical protein
MIGVRRPLFYLLFPVTHRGAEVPLAWAQNFQANGVASRYVDDEGAIQPANAEKYFKQHLQAGDYYMEGQQVLGEWFGKGAEELKLSGVTQADDFLKLCENIHRQTRERLTQRQNAKRVTVDGDGNE